MGRGGGGSAPSDLFQTRLIYKYIYVHIYMYVHIHTYIHTPGYYYYYNKRNLDMSDYCCIKRKLHIFEY